MQQAILDQAVRQAMKNSALFNIPMSELFLRNDETWLLAHMQRCSLCGWFVDAVRKAYRDLVAEVAH